MLHLRISHDLIITIQKTIEPYVLKLDQNL